MSNEMDPKKGKELGQQKPGGQGPGQQGGEKKGDHQQGGKNNEQGTHTDSGQGR